MLSDTHVAQLTHLMERELAAHTTLLQYLQDEQTALVDANIEDLQHTINRQEYLIQDIRTMEAERETLMAAIQRMITGQNLPLQIAGVIELSSPPLADTLNTVYIQFRDVLQTLVAHNEQNRKLVESGLFFVEQNLKVYFDLAKDEPFYQPQAQHAPRRPTEVRRLFDRKA